MNYPKAIKVAKLFHETYERLAPAFGYKTRKASAVKWEDVPDTNKALMVATCKTVLQSLTKPEGPIDQTITEICRLMLDVTDGHATGNADRFCTSMNEISIRLDKIKRSLAQPDHFAGAGKPIIAQPVEQIEPCKSCKTNPCGYQNSAKRCLAQPAPAVPTIRPDNVVSISQKLARVIRQAAQIWRGDFPETNCKPSVLWQNELTEAIVAITRQLASHETQNMVHKSDCVSPVQHKGELDHTSEAEKVEKCETGPKNIFASMYQPVPEGHNCDAAGCSSIRHNLTVSEICRTTFVQNCGQCEDFDCCDNMNPNKPACHGTGKKESTHDHN